MSGSGMGRFLALNFYLAAVGLFMGINLIGLGAAAWHGLLPLAGSFVEGLVVGVVFLACLGVTLWLERPGAREARGILGWWARQQRPETTPRWLEVGGWAITGLAVLKAMRLGQLMQVAAIAP